jgi:hypothetical protein
VLNEDPPSLREFRPELPPPLDSVLSMGLAKDRGARYPNCTAFAGALAGALAGETPTIARPIGAAETLKRPKTWALAALAAAMAVAALGIWGLEEEPAPEPPPTVETSPESPPEEPQPTDAQPASDLPPAAAEPRTPPPAVAKTVQPPSPTPESPVATPAPEASGEPPPAAGPTVTVVWRGKLEPGETLVVDNGAPTAGSLSRPLPAEPISVEVSPSNVEVLEAPSRENGWKTLRVRNTDHARTMFFIRYRELGGLN